MVTFKPVAVLTQAIADQLVQNGDYRFLYLSLSCLQNVKGLSLNPQLHQIALVPQKTHRQALILCIESYIGSFEATINSGFIHICL